MAEHTIHTITGAQLEGEDESYGDAEVSISEQDDKNTYPDVVRYGGRLWNREADGTWIQWGSGELLDEVRDTLERWYQDAVKANKD